MSPSLRDHFLAWFLPNMTSSLLDLILAWHLPCTLSLSATSATSARWRKGGEGRAHHKFAILFKCVLIIFVVVYRCYRLWCIYCRGWLLPYQRSKGGGWGVGGHSAQGKLCKCMTSDWMNSSLLVHGMYFRYQLQVPVMSTVFLTVLHLMAHRCTVVTSFTFCNILYSYAVQCTSFIPIAAPYIQCCRHYSYSQCYRMYLTCLTCFFFLILMLFSVFYSLL